MKKIIEEIRAGNKHFYKISFEDNDEVRDGFTIHNKVITKMHNGKKYLMLYDNNMNLIDDAFSFINFQLNNWSENTKIQYIYALKELYDYAGIIQKDISLFTYNDFIDLQRFMTGMSNIDTSANIVYYTTKSKSAQVANKYMEICKQYIEYCGYSNKQSIQKIKISNSANYTSTLKKMECPKYITYSQFQKMMDYIDDDESLNEETKLKYQVIIRLEFEHGLRSGEAFGLTLEDLKIEEDVHYIVLRNRVSDNENQYAKNLCHVKDKKEYRKNYYKEQNSKVPISKDLMNDIKKCFDLECLRLVKRKKKPMRADAVETNTIENYYLFINKRSNTVLNVDIFSKYLQKMFIDLGIEIDTDRRNNNLSHRFRHGFVMWLYEQGMKDEDIIHFTRHSSVAALQPYKNLTTKDKHKLFTNFNKYRRENKDDL